MADSNALATVGNEAVGLASVDLYSDKRIELVRRSIANGAPKELFEAMIEIARARGLDPLAKQMSLINFGGQWQITTTIDGYRALAERTGAYAGSDEAVFTHSDQKIGGKVRPDTASVTVWKLVQGQRVPFTATVYWEEFDGGNFTWKKMPHVMLAKVAESHALRKAFPAVLSGVYTAEEMDQAGPTITGEVIDHDSGEIVQQAALRQDAPRAPQSDRPAQSAQPATKPLTVAQQGINTLHANAAKVDIDHAGVHDIAVHRYGVASVNDLQGRQLFEMNKLMEKRDTAQQALKDARPHGEIIDVELTPDKQADLDDFNRRHPAPAQGSLIGSSPERFTK